MEILTEYDNENTPKSPSPDHDAFAYVPASLFGFVLVAAVVVLPARWSCVYVHDADELFYLRFVNGVGGVFHSHGSFDECGELSRDGWYNCWN